MTLTRRAVMAAFASVAATVPSLSNAQTFPSRPITIITPFAAGGTNDTIARVAARLMEPELGQPIVVANRVGAGGTVGISATLTPPLDGHNLVVAGMGSIVLAPVIHKARVKYNTQVDLVPVGVMGSVPIVLAVRASLPVQNFAELLALAKTRPGQLAYGSPGLGGTMHVATTLLEQETGVSFNHVPYKGGAPAMNDLAAGTLDMAMTDVTLLRPFIQSGRVRPLVILGSARSDLLPGVPTTSELGWPKVKMDTWYAVFAPAATPAPALARLRDAFERARKKPEMSSALIAQSVTPVSTSLRDFQEHLKHDFEVWQPIVARICGQAGCD